MSLGGGRQQIPPGARTHTHPPCRANLKRSEGIQSELFVLLIVGENSQTKETLARKKRHCSVRRWVRAARQLSPENPNSKILVDLVLSPLPEVA